MAFHIVADRFIFLLREEGMEEKEITVSQTC